MEKKVALSIAGSDPSSGAGIQADLKSFSFLGLHGITVITCVTSQNTQKVRKLYKLPVEIIENQIDILFEDFDIEAVKTGMLYNEEIIERVAKKISELPFTTSSFAIKSSLNPDCAFNTLFQSIPIRQLLFGILIFAPIL